MKVIIRYLREAAEKDRVATDPVFAKYLYEIAAPGLVNHLSKEYLYHDGEVRKSLVRR